VLPEHRSGRGTYWRPNAAARIAERRPAPAPVAPVEHPQLFEEVA
jgi:hypothetical protein